MSEITRRYGEVLNDTNAIYIPLIKAGTNDFAVGTDWTPVAGDVLVTTDGGTPGNIGELPSYVAGKGWKFKPSGSQLEGKNIVISIIDQTTVKEIEDQFIIIRTDTGKYNGAFHIDGDNGHSSAVRDVTGTDLRPVDSFQLVDDLYQDGLQLKKILVSAASTLNLDVALSGTEVVAVGFARIDMNLQNITKSVIKGAHVLGESGTIDEFSKFVDCLLGDSGNGFLVTSLIAEHCDIGDGIQMKTGGDSKFLLERCYRVGTGYGSIEFFAGKALSLLDFDGFVELVSMAASNTALVSGKGSVRIAASSTDATVYVYGNFQIDDLGTNSTIIRISNYDQYQDIKTMLALMPATTIASSIEVQSIQNNTRFVSAIPANVVIPQTGDLIYKITGYFYNTQGGMEDPDSNEFAIKINATEGAVDKTNFFDDAGGSVASSVSTTFGSPYYDMVRESTGIYSIYYKLPSTETPDQWVAEFKCKENTIDLAYTRNTVLFESDPTGVNLADNASNKDIIAESLKERDVSGTTAVAGSVYSDIFAVIDAIQAQTDKLVFTAGNSVKSNIEEVNALTDADGVSFNNSFQLSNGMANGKLRRDPLILNKVIMYKRDNLTPLTEYLVDETLKTRDRVS